MSSNRDWTATAIPGGEQCPKCGVLMQRFEHSKQWRARPGRGHFRYWDICKGCKRIQNYECARVQSMAEVENVLL